MLLEIYISGEIQNTFCERVNWWNNLEKSAKLSAESIVDLILILILVVGFRSRGPFQGHSPRTPKSRSKHLKKYYAFNRCLSPSKHQL